MAEYIAREKLLRDIEHYHVSDGKFQHWVQLQPAADVEPLEHGHWVPDEADVLFHCSNCGTQVSTSWDYEDLEWNYCPNCGARMDEHVK